MCKYMRQLCKSSHFGFCFDFHWIFSMASLRVQPLPPSHVECLRCIETFGQQARRADPIGFASIVDALGCTADVYDWLECKLGAGLTSWRKPGQAAWRWKSPGTPVRVLVWCTGARESEQTAALDMSAPQPPGCQWWPCIVHMPHDCPDEVLAFYCPALCWANARPWFVHISRCFAVPTGYNNIMRDALGINKPAAQSQPAAQSKPVRRWGKGSDSGNSASTTAPSDSGSSSSSSSSSALTASSLAATTTSAVTDISTATSGFVTVNGVTFLAVSGGPTDEADWNLAD